MKINLKKVNPISLNMTTLNVNEKVATPVWWGCYMYFTIPVELNKNEREWIEWKAQGVTKWNNH